MAGHLLKKPAGTQGCLQNVTIDSAKTDCPNWGYVGFEAHVLKAGETLSQNTGDLEHCIVIITGKMTATVDGTPMGELGNRMDIFAREKAHALYVPNGSGWSVTATTDLEVGICTAPGRGGHKPRVISPSPEPMEARGTGANTRYVNPFLMEDADWADSLLVVEVWTPNGNWSSYPSHKHDTNAFPDETYLEETYYHRINPPTGFGVQRVYNDDRSLDETMTIEDRDLVLVPEGYHPCGALYGHDLYYLNVMAGPMRKWRFRNDPDHDWVFQRDLKT